MARTRPVARVRLRRPEVLEREVRLRGADHQVKLRPLDYTKSALASLRNPVRKAQVVGPRPRHVPYPNRRGCCSHVRQGPAPGNTGVSGGASRDEPRRRACKGQKLEARCVEEGISGCEGSVESDRGCCSTRFARSA